MPNRMLKDWTASIRIDLLSPEAEVFFVRLIMKADDHGCFHGNPKLLNSLLFPLKEYSFSEVLKWRTECQKAGIIKVYTNDAQNFVQIIDFGQRLRSMNSKFPQPADNCQQTVVECRPEENRREEEVEEKGKSLRAIDLPFDSIEFQTAWISWEQFRKELHKKITPSTAKKQIEFLASKSERIAIEIINQSIKNGWTGLFEIKTNGTTTKRQQNSDSLKQALADSIVKEFGTGEV